MIYPAYSGILAAYGAWKKGFFYRSGAWEDQPLQLINTFTAISTVERIARTVAETNDFSPLEGYEMELIGWLRDNG